MRRRSKDEHELLDVAKEFAAFRPAREVLSVVRAVPTCLPQFDRATGVGGLPIERFMVMHGRSGEGKTIAMLAFARSFLERSHFALYIDAERTTPIDFAQKIVGDYAHSDRFFAMRPTSYEATVKAVRDWALTIARLRDEGKVPPTTAAFIGLDSIRKLVPEGILKRIMKDDDAKQKKGKDIGGRAAQIKAAMNAAWMDELIPLLERAGAAMVVIARETEDPDADLWAKAAGNAFKIGGGSALVYDSSLVLRVERDRYVTERKWEEGKPRPKVFGERHLLTIRKTKIAGHEDKVTECYFHTSNGVLVPPGLDLARDLLELGEQVGVLHRSSSWLQWHKRKWNGDHQAVRALHSDPDMLRELDAEVRATFKDHDAETGEVSA